jgi:hypothetical protein
VNKAARLAADIKNAQLGISLTEHLYPAVISWMVVSTALKIKSAENAKALAIFIMEILFVW